MADPRSYGDAYGSSSDPAGGGPSVADQMLAAYPPGARPANFGIPNPAYNNMQASLTSMRAAYGDVPAMTMVGAGAVYGGAMSGMGQMFSDLGSMVQPITYTPPARVMSGYAGRYVQNTSLYSDVKILSGLSTMPRGVRAADLHYNAASDLGERIALGAAGLGMGLAGMAGGAIGSNLLGGLGVAGNLAGGLFGYAAVGAVADRVYEGVAARRDIQGYLEATSANYITSSSSITDPRRGSGMSVQARQQVGDMIRTMDVRDPTLTTADLTGVLKTSTELGMMNGTRDVDDFKKKFKDIVENLKVVTKTLGQTLDEGLKTMKDLKGIGVDPSQVRNVVLNAEVLGRVAGRSAGEMMNLGLQGAEVFRGTGVDMKIGFAANVMNAASIRAARDAGLLSQESVAQAGGEEALAQRMTASSLQYAQTATARGIAGAYFNAGLGGSGFNQQAFMNSVMNGGGSFNSMAAAAAGNLGDPAALIKYQANQELINSEMGNAFGGRGLELRRRSETMMQATQLAKITGASAEDSYRFIAQQQGLSKPVIDTDLAAMKNAQGELAAAQKSALSTRDQQIVEQSLNRTIWGRIGARVSDFFTEKTDPISGFISKTTDDFQLGARLFFEEQFDGVQRVNTGRTGMEQVLSDNLSSVRRRGRVDLSEGGTFRSQTTASDLREILQNSQKKRSIFSNIFEKTINTEGRGVSADRGLFESETLSTSRESIEAAAKVAEVTSRSLLQAQQADQAGLLVDQKKTVDTALRKMGSELNSITDVNTLARKIYGKDVSKLSRAEWDALRLQTKGVSKVLDKAFDSAEQESANVIAVANDVSVRAQKADVAALEGKREEILGKLGLTDVDPQIMGKLAELNAVKNDPEKVSRAKSELTDMVMKGNHRELLTKLPMLVGAATSTGRGMDQLFTEYNSLNRSIAAENVFRGSQQLVGAARERISSDKTLTQDEKLKLLGITESLGGKSAQEALDFTQRKDFKDDLKLLHEKQISPTLEKALGAISDISDHKVSSEELGKTLKGTGLSDAAIGDVTKMYASGQTKQAVEAVWNGTTSAIAGTAAVGTVGGGGSASGQPTGTPQDQYALQTNMNLMTYQAMQALAARLGVK